MQAMATVNEDFIPTRETLLIRLRDWKDDESWRQFFETYWKLIYKATIRAGLSDAEARDVVQETIVDVARKLPDFRYDPEVGSFKGYLLRLTKWRIADQLRRRVEGTVSSELLADTADPNGFLPETYWNEEWERNLMDIARERIKKKVNPRHYQIFDLHMDQGWPAHKVADALNVRTALVYVVRHRLGRLLAKEIKQLQAEEYHEDDHQ